MSFEPTTPEPEQPLAPTAFEQPGGAPAPDPETGLFVNPLELPSFTKLQQQIERARQEALTVPEKIEDEQSAGKVSDALNLIKHARQDVDRIRKDEKRPYEHTGKRIDAAFNELLSPVLGVEERLKEQLVDFETRREREIEAQRKREEKAARERQARADKKAAETGVAGKHHAPPPPKEQPTGARGQISKTSVKKVRKWRVTDINALPEDYVEKVPRKEACTAAAKAGIVVPGLEYYDDRVVATR